MVVIMNCGKYLRCGVIKKALLLLCLPLWLAGCATQPGTTLSETLFGPTRLFVEGGASGAVTAGDYFVIFSDESLSEDSVSDEQRKHIMNYASYILRYRGLQETYFIDDAEYLLLVSFQEYDEASNRQIFQLSAGSKRVYEATREFRPRWIASSIHVGKPRHPEAMLAMHTLAIRNFAGGNPLNASAEYDADSEQVQDLIDRVEVHNFIGELK